VFWPNRWRTIVVKLQKQSQIILYPWEELFLHRKRTPKDNRNESQEAIEMNIVASMSRDKADTASEMVKNNATVTSSCRQKCLLIRMLRTISMLIDAPKRAKMTSARPRATSSRNFELE